MVRTNSGGRWRLRTNNFTSAPGGGTQKYERELDRPAPTVSTRGDLWRVWPYERPATTVQGDLRVAPPGHHEHTRGPDSIPVTIAELGVLQGFPADHPWQAPCRSAQVGNAIPPPLALACLRAVTSIHEQRPPARRLSGVHPA